MTPPASIKIRVRLEPDEVAQLVSERDRARHLAARLASIAQERERLLWLAIEPQPTMLAEMEVGRVIARHLRETSFIPGVLEAGL